MKEKTPTTKNKKKKWIIALIVLILLVLAVIIFRDLIMDYIDRVLFKHIYASW